MKEKRKELKKTIEGYLSTLEDMKTNIENKPKGFPIRETLEVTERHIQILNDDLASLRNKEDISDLIEKYETDK